MPADVVFGDPEAKMRQARAAKAAEAHAAKQQKSAAGQAVRFAAADEARIWTAFWPPACVRILQMLLHMDQWGGKRAISSAASHPCHCLR